MASLGVAPAPTAQRSQSTSPARQLTCDKVEKCVRLKILIGNPDRAWVKQPEEPAAFANGIRLFAYMALQKQLACDELAAALLEIENAKKALRGPVLGVSPLQLVAVRRLSVRVARDLQAEATARCRSGKG